MCFITHLWNIDQCDTYPQYKNEDHYVEERRFKGDRGAQNGKS